MAHQLVKSITLILGLSITQFHLQGFLQRSLQFINQIHGVDRLGSFHEVADVVRGKQGLCAEGNLVINLHQLQISPGAYSFHLSCFFQHIGLQGACCTHAVTICQIGIAGINDMVEITCLQEAVAAVLTIAHVEVQHGIYTVTNK